MKRPIGPGDPRHGTTPGYAAGCHEACCRPARARQERVRRHWAAQGRPATYPAVLVRRRLQALMVTGWTAADLAPLLGYSTPESVHNLVKADRVEVYAATYRAVCALYNRLWRQEGPSELGRRRARAKGWPGPLSWDDEPPEPGEPNHWIDDPAATPAGVAAVEPRRDGDADAKLVEVALSGVRVYGATRAQRLQVAERWQQLGRSLNDLDRLQGWNVFRDRRGARVAA